MNGLNMLKKIEPRIVVPLVLGMMFALGDEASNPEGHIMQIKSALCVKVLLFCVLFCVLFRFADWLIAEVQGAKREDQVEHYGFFEYGYAIKPWLKNAAVIAVCCFRMNFGCSLACIGRIPPNSCSFIMVWNDSRTIILLL